MKNGSSVNGTVNNPQQLPHMQALPTNRQLWAIMGMRIRILRKVLGHPSRLPAAAGAEASPRQHRSLSSLRTQVQGNRSQGTGTCTDGPQAMDLCAAVD